MNNDDYCNNCNIEIDFAICYCCTICWKLICPNCIILFNKNTTLYTICKNTTCIYINKLLHIKFDANIAKYIADYHPNI